MSIFFGATFQRILAYLVIILLIVSYRSVNPMLRSGLKVMTVGQVKEELVARFGELGIRVSGGAVRFEPALLRRCEFGDAERPFRYLDVAGNWSELAVPAQGLAFTWCQVPLVYRLDDGVEPGVSVVWDSGEEQVLPDLALPADIAAELFQRSGRVRNITLVLNSNQLLPS